LEKANKDRGDTELFIINKISSDPSLLKRGIKLMADTELLVLLSHGGRGWRRGGGQVEKALQIEYHSGVCWEVVQG
jgi:hypothetical protein